MNKELADLFDRITDFPDPDARRSYDQLVGLDEFKKRLEKEGSLILAPALLDDWSKTHHGQLVQIASRFRDRAPLFLFAGDVGTGKTELASTFGDRIARANGVPVTLYSLSLSARGFGAVGEMTTLLSRAFEEVRQVANRAQTGSGTRGALILLIDEADALAQSRELAQMHHEDRAGVNALIRGIDDIARSRVPVLVVMCTNRVEAIDPAVRRRAAAVFSFKRPSEEQRLSLLSAALSDVGFGTEELLALARTTGANGRGYGCTYSDLTQRFLPSLVLDAFPDRPVDFERAIALAKELEPTPPFGGAEG